MLGCLTFDATGADSGAGIGVCAASTGKAADSITVAVMAMERGFSFIVEFSCALG
jgi:hypothetical protein